MQVDMSSNGHFCQEGKREPEAYKLFVGQVPKTWTDKELRPIFEPYGEIFEISILQDKYTGTHKGCAFLTYYSKESAQKAQNAMHDKVKLDGMSNFIQVKPADSETKAEDRKLFVGMISKRATEEDMKIMFSPFGTIEELTILRNTDGSSKACCFIKFANRLQAQTAIRSMHNCQTMDGCSSPIVVKLADREKDKMQKRMQSVASNLVAMGLGMQLQQPTGLPASAAANGLQMPQYYNQILNQTGTANLLAQALGSGMSSPNPLVNMLNPIAMNAAMPGGLGAMVAAAALANQQSVTQPGSVSQLQQQTNSASLFSTPASVSQHQQASLATSQPSSNAFSLQANPAINPMSGLTSLSSLAGVNSIANLANPTAAAQNAGSFNPADALTQAFSGIQQFQAAFPHAYGGLYHAPAAQRQPQKEGPEGANLFIYHLPQEFTDADLLQTFSPFGNVLSAKVFIDKATKFSKCFGFVSYDNPGSAQQAIATMNQFTIGSKKLKVQLKRPKEQNRPY